MISILSIKMYAPIPRFLENIIKARNIYESRKKKKQRKLQGVPVMAQQVKDPTMVSVRILVQSLAWLSRLRMLHCHKFCCR